MIGSYEKRVARKRRERLEEVKAGAVEVCKLLSEGKVAEAKKKALKVVHVVGLSNERIGR